MLAAMSEKGFVAYSAKLFGQHIELGKYSFIGDGVVLYQNPGSGKIMLGEKSSINQTCIVETGEGGSVIIGSGSHIQPNCQLSAYKGDLVIGNAVQIAPNCAFYPYNHGFATDKPIMQQALSSKGGIVIEDDVWLSYGVVVLDGVTIGKGAVIGAGAVVARDVPAGAIAAGIPARVIGQRQKQSD
ncbi:MAG: acyltransferase [Gammaproteobacteria bacterium]|nr:acyltransferase [Gammaproteobacteria bacterium]